MTLIGPVIIQFKRNESNALSHNWAYIQFDDKAAIISVYIQKISNEAPIPSLVEDCESLPYVPNEIFIYDPSVTTDRIFLIAARQGMPHYRFNFRQLDGTFQLLPTPFRFNASHENWTPEKIEGIQKAIKEWDKEKDISRQGTEFSILFKPTRTENQIANAQENTFSNAQSQYEAWVVEKEAQKTQWERDRRDVDFDSLAQEANQNLINTISLTNNQIARIKNSGFYNDLLLMKSVSSTQEEYCDLLKKILKGNVDGSLASENNAFIIRSYMAPKFIESLNAEWFYKNDAREIKPSVYDVHEWLIQFLILEGQSYDPRFNLSLQDTPNSVHHLSDEFRERNIKVIESPINYSTFFRVVRLIQSPILLNNEPIQEIRELKTVIENIVQNAEEPYITYRATLENIYLNPIHGQIILNDLTQLLSSIEEIIHEQDVLAVVPEEHPLRSSENLIKTVQDLNSVESLKQFLQIRHPAAPDTDLTTSMIGYVYEAQKLNDLIQNKDDIAKVFEILNLLDKMILLIYLGTDFFKNESFKCSSSNLI